MLYVGSASPEKNSIQNSFRSLDKREYLMKIFLISYQNHILLPLI